MDTVVTAFSDQYKQRFTIHLSRGPLTVPNRPLVMGIINCTPDSFYAESRSETTETALETARRMIEDGADILDIGGESSRPGSEYVEADEEIARVIPVIEKIRKISSVPISVDTRKSEVADRALGAGADMINDISALRDDPELASVVVRHDCPVVLMHMKGTPSTMQVNPVYEDPVEEILSELATATEGALRAGIPTDRIIIDPGIGFGKRLEDNLRILAEISRFVDTGYPVLIGVSRKSSIGAITGRDVRDRLAGTLAANLMAAIRGAAILRVHDVPETLDLLKVASAITNAQRHPVRGTSG